MAAVINSGVQALVLRHAEECRLLREQNDLLRWLGELVRSHAVSCKGLKQNKIVVNHLKLHRVSRWQYKPETGSKWSFLQLCRHHRNWETFSCSQALVERLLQQAFILRIEGNAQCSRSS